MTRRTRSSMRQSKEQKREKEESLEVEEKEVLTMTRKTRSNPRKTKEQKLEKKEEVEAEEVENQDSDDSENSNSESEDSNDSESGDDDDDDDEVDDEDVDVAAALFKGTNAQDDDDEEESESENDETKEKNVNAMDTSSSQSESYTFDLRNMLAISTDQLATGSLYNSESNAKKTKSNSSKSQEEIPLDPKNSRGISIEVDEEFLLSKATAGCTQLIRALWQLPTEQSDAGPLVTLPTFDEVKLPRSMPPPPPKQETKWEKFAKAKGIVLNKEKRSRKVWDDDTGSWKFRHGYEKANKKDNEWPIMEVGAEDDPYADPWEKQREDKRERVEKNVANRMKNEERAGNLTKGATNRAIKGIQQKYISGKEGGRKDSSSMPLPTGLPVDLLNTNNPNNDNMMRGKKSTLAALKAVQTSTASLGKFDKMREGEPERKKTFTAKLKKRKFENSTDKKVTMTEGQSSMKILNAVMNGGGVSKAKAARKGQLATGETAYDYEFNDGLGASSFRKKKGRAGAGKMKKITKKRAK